VSLIRLLAAWLNVVPPALLVLGVGALVMGVWPRAVSISTYAVITWSFLIELIGGFISSNHWLLDTSVFHQMASAPAVPPDWTAGGCPHREHLLPSGRTGLRRDFRVIPGRWQRGEKVFPLRVG